MVKGRVMKDVMGCRRPRLCRKEKVGEGEDEVDDRLLITSSFSPPFLFLHNRGLHPITDTDKDEERKG